MPPPEPPTRPATRRAPRAPIRQPRADPRPRRVVSPPGPPGGPALSSATPPTSPRRRPTTVRPTSTEPLRRPARRTRSVRRSPRRVQGAPAGVLPVQTVSPAVGPLAVGPQWHVPTEAPRPTRQRPDSGLGGTWGPARARMPPQAGRTGGVAAASRRGGHLGCARDSPRAPNRWARRWCPKVPPTRSRYRPPRSRRPPRTQSPAHPHVLTELSTRSRLLRQNSHGRHCATTDTG